VSPIWQEALELGDELATEIVAIALQALGAAIARAVNLIHWSTPTAPRTAGRSASTASTGTSTTTHAAEPCCSRSPSRTLS
jgi:hypothetical protein